MGIKVGDTAPDFTLKNGEGVAVTLSELLKQKSVVLYFYPKDDTTGCTVEACSFRDAYEDFTAAGAEVVGVSSDSAASHEKFAQKNRLPFVLLSDKGGALRKQYGVPGNLFGLVPGRVTYVIGKDAKVRLVFDSQIQFKRHIKEALEALKA